MQAAALDRRAASTRALEVIIVGAGFGGIAAAIELLRHGIQRITILEQGADLGGTWLFNTYPGAACDVPSHLYSFSYAQRRDWTRLCSMQPEIHAYLREVARAHQIDRLIEANQTVTSCSWEEQSARWSVHSSDGSTRQADVLIVATGQLHRPSIPPIEGVRSFAGHSFHSGAWDHDYRLRGKRVAVVGTGASAVQFIPEIAAEVERLSVFQRTGNWFLPRRNRRYPAALKAAIAHLPGLQALRRRFIFEYTESLTLTIRHPRTIGRIAALRSAAFMRSQLKDPELRARAWPDYTFGCKRILFSSYFLPTLARENVQLVTDRIARVTPQGILTDDGRLHELDCIIWATGFKTNDFMLPMEISGAGGRKLQETWSQGARAYLGITVPRFPNMFLMYGPNTNTSGGSIIVYLETQAAYLRQALQQLQARGASAIDVLPEVEAAADRALQARFSGTAWMQCDSWYRDQTGRIVANWPGYMREYLDHTRQLNPDEYRFFEPSVREPRTSRQMQVGG